MLPVGKASICQERNAGKGSTECFQGFFDRFTLYLTTPQLRHFRHLVIAIVVWIGAHTITGLREVHGHEIERDQSSVNRFVNLSPWRVEWLHRARWQCVIEQVIGVLPEGYHHGASVTGYLIIDDTIEEKTGKKMEHLGWHYSHAEGRNVWGHCYVTVLYVIAGFAFPVSVQLYRKKESCEAMDLTFRSKIELAIECIKAFTPVPGTRTVVLFDTWYAAEFVIKAALARGFEVVCGMKSNRVLRSDKHREGRVLSELALRKDVPSHVVTVKNCAYRVCQLEGYLKGNLRASLLISKSPAHGTKFFAYLHPGQDRPALIDPLTILTHYSHRWSIETFHRNAKQLLGFGDYQIRNAKGISRYLELVLIAYTALEAKRGQLALMQPDAPPPTLAEICRQTQNDSLTGFILWIYDQFQKGVSPDVLCQRLAG